MRLFLALVLASALLSGCAGRETTRLMADRGSLPSAAHVVSVPFHPQEDKACGPASLAMVLNWSGLPTSTEAMSTMVYTPGREGSLAADMLGAARRSGRLAVPLSGLDNVLGELAAGHPVVVFQNLGLEMHPLWHFAVAIGFDLDRREIILHTGLDEAQPMSLDTFEHTWERTGRWAMVVLPPDTLPATSGEAEVVNAVASLERGGWARHAAQAYELALHRWSDSLAAAIGLGNARYAQGDLPAAEAAFRRAAERHPDAAPAWNNLAHVLMERGKGAEALMAAQRAVAIAGADGLYGETLQSVAGP